MFAEPATGTETRGTPASEDAARAIAESLSALDEAGRYRLLARLFAGFAEQPSGDGASRSATAEQLKALAQSVQRFECQVAELQDLNRALEAELQARSNQLQAADLRLQAAGRSAEELKSQALAASRARDDLDRELTVRTRRLEQLEQEKQAVEVQLQRSLLAQADDQQRQAAAEAVVRLSQELKARQAELDELRAAKSAEIEALKRELLEARSAAGESGNRALAALWERLGSLDPTLAGGRAQPTAQAGERLADTVIEMSRFVQSLDGTLRDFLNRTLRGHHELSSRWRAYCERGDFPVLLRDVLDPLNGRPAGMLKIRLAMTHKWILAVLLANDIAAANISSELQGHLAGNLGTGADPKCTVRDYLRRNGPDAFQVRMLEAGREALEKTLGA